MPFTATVVSATRRRCRLTTLERAAAAWCLEKGITERPAQLVPPEASFVLAWLKRLRVKAVVETLELYQIEAGSVAINNRRVEWRAEFDISRGHDVYMNAKAVARVLGFGEMRGHITVRRLIQAGFLAGFEADKEAEYVYGHRDPTWNKTTHGRRWRIHPDDLADFLLGHPEQYDRALVRGNPWKALAAEAARKKRWLRVPEIAERLGCSQDNVRDMLRLGDLQGVLMRDRQAISYYVRPAWLIDLPKGDSPQFLRTIHGRKGMPPERKAYRARILAERVKLQEHHDADAKRLLCEVRDIAGRRRKAREAAALEREMYPGDNVLFPKLERTDPRWRMAAAFLQQYPDDGWDEAAD